MTLSLSELNSGQGHISDVNRFGRKCNINLYNISKLEECCTDNSFKSLLNDDQSKQTEQWQSSAAGCRHHLTNDKSLQMFQSSAVTRQGHEACRGVSVESSHFIFGNAASMAD